MAITNFKKWAQPLALSSALSAVCLAPSVFADAANAKMNYLLDGKVVAGWTAITGDPEKWWSPLTELQGQSGSGKLVVEPGEFKAPGDAVKLTWAARKNVLAQFSLGGSPVDIKSLESAAALVINMRVLTAPDKPVNIAMRCGENCEAKVDIAANLKKLKKSEWVAFPIALNCFSTAGADLSKIATPFEIGTDGKLSVEISTVRLEKLAPSDKGCVAP